MTASLNRRLEALERPGGYACLSCALSALNCRADAPPNRPQSPCTHPARITLAEELQGLNTIEGMTT